MSRKIQVLEARHQTSLYSTGYKLPDGSGKSYRKECASLTVHLAQEYLHGDRNIFLLDGTFDYGIQPLLADKEP